jgi:nitric oxide reductase NorQ protein
MVKKWTSAELQIGALMEATFWPNPVKDSGFRFRATHLDGRKAPKVVLCDDVRIRTGAPCQVRIKAINKPARDDRGYVEVEFVKQQEFKIEGVYLDPVVAKKLPVLLESGLNIRMD